MFSKKHFWELVHLIYLKNIFAPACGNFARRLCVYTLRSAIKILYILSPNLDLKLIIKIIKKYNGQDTHRIGNFAGAQDAVWDESVITNGFINGSFEGKQYKIPAEYDKFLRGLYGDYMQLPPINERTVPHNLEAYKLEEPEELKKIKESEGD